MTELNRLEKGGRIERAQSITFSFNGKRYTGCQRRYYCVGLAS